MCTRGCAARAVGAIDWSVNDCLKRSGGPRFVKRSRTHVTIGRVQDAFSIVLVVVLVGAVVAAVWAGVSSRNPYGQIGRGGLSLNEDAHLPRPTPSAAVLAGEREAEVRQMLEARNHRRATRGQEPIDVEAELRALLDARPVVNDPALVAEVRDLVIARNARRARAGKPPLDVEEEVARQLRELT
jgi:hypothetical protein